MVSDQTLGLVPLLGTQVFRGVSELGLAFLGTVNQGDPGRSFKSDLINQKWMSSHLWPSGNAQLP